MRLTCFTALVLAVVLPCLLPAEGLAKTVICISGGGGKYLNNAEGYYRQNYPVPPNEIHVGGNLRDCLSKLGPEDELFLVTHGAQSTFIWNGTRYAGFSGGRDATGTGWPGLPAFPLPPNFTDLGLNISVLLLSCYSAEDPDGDPISLTSNMDDALAPGGGASGCELGSGTYRGRYTFSGGTQAQRDAARACLEGLAAGMGYSGDEAGVRDMLSNFPPANSPSVPNAQTVANNSISPANCPGAGGQVTIVFDYSCAPIDPAPLAMATCDPADLDIGCAETTPPSLPAYPPQRLAAAIGLMALLFTALVRWHRRAATAVGPWSRTVDHGARLTGPRRARR